MLGLFYNSYGVVNCEPPGIVQCAPGTVYVFPDFALLLICRNSTLSGL